MVLHNSKWDRKATKNYYKKHGIAPPPRKPRQPRNPDNEESDESTTSDVDINDLEEQNIQPEVDPNDPDLASALIPDLPQALPKFGRRKNVKDLPSNNWRYNESEEAHDERTMDEAQLAEKSFAERQQALEEEELKLARQARFKADEIDLDSVPKSRVLTKKKGKLASVPDDYVYDDSQDIDLYELDESNGHNAFSKPIASSTVASGSSGTKRNIIKMNDTSEFHKLQNEIEKAKAAQLIKKKFGKNKNDGSGLAPEQDFDDFMAEIEGLNIKDEQRNVSKDSSSKINSTLDLEDLLNINTNVKKPATSLFSRSSAEQTPAQKSSQHSQAWLDNLLN